MTALLAASSWKQDRRIPRHSCGRPSIDPTLVPSNLDPVDPEANEQRWKGWGLCLLGLFSIGYGIVGLVQRRLVTVERTQTVLEGPDAVVYSILALVVGLILIAVGVDELRS